MNYLAKAAKYALIKRKLAKRNPFFFSENNANRRIFLFFVAAGTNMGDHAIVEAERKFIANCVGDTATIVEITTSQTESAISWLKGKIRSDDLIVLSGGGYIGDEYIEIYKPLLRILKQFKENKIVIFPQTIFFASKEREKRFCELVQKCSNIEIYVRELTSKEIFARHGIVTRLVPDIVLSTVYSNHQAKRTDQILVCMRNDVERKISTNEFNIIVSEAQSVGNVIITDTVESETFPLVERESVLGKMLDRFASSKLVITDRIHGMIFAYITRTPCVVLGNYNHKVESEYEWISNCEYITFIREVSPDNLQASIKEVLSSQKCSLLELDAHFGSLAGSLEEYYGKKSV